MKKTLLILSSILLLGLGSSMAQNNDNGYVGRARGAANDCINPFFNGNDWIIMESVNTVGSCVAGGFITQVVFAARPVQQPCTDFEGCPPPALPIVIATVTFGCNNELMSVNCY